MRNSTDDNVRDIDSFSTSSCKFYDKFKSELAKQHLDFQSTAKVGLKIMFIPENFLKNLYNNLFNLNIIFSYIEGN